MTSTHAELVRKHKSVRGAARAAGVSYATFHDRLTKEKRVAFETTPDVDDRAPIGDVIAAKRKQFERKQRRHSAESWQSVTMRGSEPIGILWFGDPHLDDDGCNWPVLQDHVALCASTPGLYGANIGDTTNNWAGRLARLYAKQETSQKTAQQLASWFVGQSGVTWLLWLMGNHDLWEGGGEMLKTMDVHNRVLMRDWAARIELKFANGARVKVHAAHDFPGHSMWNENHGPLRAAKLGGVADLYVCGHRHTWSVGQFETPDGRTPVVARARGYKCHDDYALVGGFHQAKHGAAILTIIDPRATGPGRVLAFSDVAQGARVLTAMRAEPCKRKPRR